MGQFDPTGKAGLTLKEARAKAGELTRLYLAGTVDIKGHLAAELRLQVAQRKVEEAAMWAVKAATKQ